MRCRARGKKTRGRRGQGERRPVAAAPLTAPLAAGRAAAAEPLALAARPDQGVVPRHGPLRERVAPRRRLALLAATEGRRRVVDVERKPRAARPFLRLRRGGEEGGRRRRRDGAGLRSGRATEGRGGACRSMPPPRASLEGHGGRRERVFARDRSLQPRGRRPDDRDGLRDQLASALESNTVLSDKLARLDRDQHRATALADELRRVAGGLDRNCRELTRVIEDSAWSMSLER